MDNIFDLLAKQGKHGIEKVREELALQLTTADGGVLSPESLEPIIVELVRKLSPLIAGITVIQSNGKTHEFNNRTALPEAYFEGENASTPSSKSSYNRISVPLKIIHAKGGVTGFQQAASKAFVDSFVKEVQGASQATAWAIEFGVMWGNATADQYQFSGVDTWISTNRIDKNAVITLRYLDDMIDPILNAGVVDRTTLAFYLSPQMLSKISTLQTEARISIEKVIYAGGLEMASYRGIPLIPTSFTRATSQMSAPSVANDAASGGLQTGKTYRYKVAAVTTTGEQWASDETSLATITGTATLVTWVAVAGARLYKIYRTVGDGATGTEKYLTTVAAKTYDGDGTITGNKTQFIDTLADGTIGNDYPLSFTNKDEVIFLLDLDPEKSIEIAGLRNQQGEVVKNLIQMLPLARTKDVEEFLLLSYLALVFKGDIFNAMLRRVRVA